MSEIQYHGGRGGAATKGWKLEQLVYASLKVVFGEKKVIYQYVSPHLRCTPDFLVHLKNRNMILSITSGPDKVARRYTSNSKYPFWETIGEFFYIKTSNDPNIIPERDICVNIIFGRKDFWVPWLISGFETIFEDNLFVSYQGNDFNPIETELNQIYTEYSKKVKNKKELEFSDFLIDTISNMSEKGGVQIAYKNMVEYFKRIESLKVKPLHDLWSKEKKHLTDIVPNLHLLDEQLQAHSEPCDRPSFRWYFIVKAVFTDEEIDVIKTVDSGTDTLEEIADSVDIDHAKTLRILKYLEELGVIGIEDHSLNGPRYYIKSERPEIVNVVRTIPPLDETTVKRIMEKIIKERSGELQENFEALKNWDEIFAPIRNALLIEDKTTSLEELKKVWNAKKQTSLFRKILLDASGLKQNDFMDILGVYADQIIFYYREFSEEETENVCKRILERLEQNYGSISQSVSDIEGDSRARFAQGRIWGDLNNPKLQPYHDYIEENLKKLEDVVLRKGLREESFFPKLILDHPEYLKTYPEHAKSFPRNSGIVESHWVIEKSDRRYFLKSRYADSDTIDHRRPEECGRCRSARYQYDKVSKTFQEKKNLTFVFIPDGYWREEDLWFLIEAGYKVYLTIEEFIQRELQS